MAERKNKGDFHRTGATKNHNTGDCEIMIFVDQWQMFSIISTFWHIFVCHKSGGSCVFTAVLPGQCQKIWWLDAEWPKS